MNPVATNHPVSWFKKFHDSDELDLTPSFQRKPVWSDAQASYLIDTVLSNLPVPEIFVRTITNSKGGSFLEVVDGQQRLRSIIRFYTGDLTLSGKDVTPAWEGTNWESLTKDQREQFWAFKLVVRELEDASDAEVRDMFRRLNANQSNLNKQELRHSQYTGEFIDSVESIADDSWWLDNKITTPAQIRRMTDAEFVSELLVGLIAGPLNKKDGLDDYYSDYDEYFPDRKYWESKFIETREIVEYATRGDLSKWKTKTEFYSLFLACARFAIDGESLPTGAQDRLEAFREVADRAKRKGQAGNFPDFIIEYAEAATRASTDLSRRVKRIEVVEEIINGSKTV